MKIEWNRSMTRKTLAYVIAGVGIMLAYFIMSNFDSVKGIWNSAFDILRPFTLGVIFTYLLNGPLMFFERKLCVIEKTKPRRKLKRVLAIIATWVATVAVLSAFFYIVMPDVTKSINVLINNIPHYLSNLQGLVKHLTVLKHRLWMRSLNSGSVPKSSRPFLKNMAKDFCLSLQILQTFPYR